MNKKILLLAAGLLAVVISVVIFKSRGPTVPAGPSAMDMVKQADFERLQSAGGDEQEKAKSLRRMAFQDPARAAGLARAWLAHSSAVLRAAACQVAGGFSEETWDKSIAECLSHNDTDVRINTLKGFLRQPTLKRRGLAERRLADVKASPAERLWAQLAVIYALSEGKERSVVEKRLMAELIKIDRATQGEILIELYKHWPNDPRLIPFAERTLKKAEITPDFFPGLRYLSAYAPEDLSRLLIASKWPDSRTFLLEVERYLSAKCPKGWVAIHNRIASHAKADEALKRELTCPAI